MNIALIYPSSDKAYFRRKPVRVQGSISLGISYISSVLKLNGHHTRLFVLTHNNSNKIEKLLSDYKPQLICFTAVSTTYHLVKQLAEKYKSKHPDVFLVAGGCHTSMNPESVISDSFDAICVGEGEYPVTELANQLQDGISPSRIMNLWIKNGTNIQRNPTRPYIENLDSIPFPDRAIWEEWVRYRETSPVILISRGCPFNCTYCCHHKLAGLASGTYYRFRSPRNILDEIEECLNAYPATRDIYLETETIFISTDYVKNLCLAIEKFNSERIQPLAFSANLRITPDTDYEILFEYLHRANFTRVNVGLESGSEQVRSKVLRRTYSNDDIIRAATCAAKFGIKISLYVMIGLPGETSADFRQTVETSRKCKPDTCMLSIFYPYPGTELAHLSREKDLFDRSIDLRKVDERKRPVLKLPDFPRRYVLRHYIWFEYYVFKGRRPLHKILFRVFQSKVFTSPRLEKFFNSLLDTRFLFYLKNKLINY